MLIEELFASVQEVQETWNLDDGTYTGEITEFKLVNDNTYIILKVSVGDNTIFMNYSAVQTYKHEPLSALLKGIEDTDEAVGKQVKFTIKNRFGRDGKQFSNITAVQYL